LVCKLRGNYHIAGNGEECLYADYENVEMSEEDKICMEMLTQKISFVSFS